jgi:collagen type III alpha
MASSTDKHSDADFHSLVEDAPDSHSQRADGYVDFDEYIDIQLRKTSSTIKSTDVLTAVVGAGTLLTTYLLIFIVFDQWVIPGGFGSTARVVLLSSLLVAVAGWIGWKVIWPWRRHVNGLYSATTIEKASPSFKGSLVSLVDLLRTEREIPPEVFRSIERRAAVALTHVDVRETVDRRSLLRLSVALFAVVVAFCGYWILSPKNPASSLWRAVAPASEAAVATRTKIDSVRPGDVDVVARSQVDVTAEVRGQMPSQATLYYTTADHKFVDERIDARPSAEGSREFHFVINGDNGAGILQDLKYRIEAGDDKTGDYKIHVIQPPAATIDAIHLDYPEYTRLGTSDQTTGAIDAIEGTHVKLRATANMPLRSASLQFFDEESASKRAEEIPMHVDGGKKLQAEWDLRIRQDGTYPHFYRIFCTGAEGEMERSPNLYSLAIRPDQPPVVVLRDPKTDLDLPANAVLPLLIEAHDPDFALTSVNLKIEKDGAPLIGPSELFDGHGRHEQQYKGTYRWSLSDYHFHPKDTITYWLEAQDNRKPLANTANSARLRIHITDPVPQSKVKKNLEMAENRQQQEAKNEEQNAAQKPDEDSVADAPRPQQKQPKQPKDQKANAQGQEQTPDEMKQAEQEGDKKPKDKQGDKGQGGGDGGNSDNGNSQNGNSENGNSKNGKGQSQGKSDKSSGEGGEKGQPEKMDPDKDSSAPKALQKIYDHMQQDTNNSESKDGNKESNKDGSANKSDAAKQDQKPESESADQGQKNEKGAAGQREKQGGQQNKDSQPAAEPNPKSDSNSKDGKNNNGSKPDGKNKDGKNGDDSKSPNEAGNRSEQNQPQPKNSAGGGDKNSHDQKPNGNPQDDKNPSEARGDKQDKQPGTKPSGDPQATDKQAADKASADKQPGDKASGDKQPGENQKPDSGKPSDSPQKDEKGQNGEAGDKPQNDAGSKQEKGQPSPGDQSGTDKSGGKSSDSPQKSEQGQSSKPDASNPSKPNGANANGQPDKPNQGGSPQDASQQPDASQDKPQKDAKSQGQSSDQKSDQSRQKQDKKNPTKSTDGTERDGDRSTQPQQQDTGAKPHPGKPQNDTHQFKPNNAPDGKPDEKAPKGRRKNTEDPEENPKNIENKTNEKPQTKGMRDEQQPNPNGDEQSGVGKTGDTKRTKDKNSPLEQEGTDNPGAKRQVREKNPDAKTGRDQPSQDPASPDKPQQSGKEGQPGSPKEQSKTGDPSQQQQQGQDGQPQQGQKGQPGKEGQQAQEGENGQPTKDGQPGQKPGKPGGGAQSPDGKPTDTKQGSQSPGGKAPGMGSGKGNSNGGGHNNGTGTGDGEGLVDTSKQANLDYARQATDLMLNRLEKQLSRGKVDEKLLKELGWTKDEVRRFVERMRRQSKADQGNSPADEARRLQYEETLRSLELKKSAVKRSGSGLQKVGGVEMESRRSTPPAEYRELYEAFNRSVNGSQTPRDKK